MKLRFVLPLLVFFIIVFFLWRGLHLHPEQIPSPLIDKLAPTFELTILSDAKKKTSEKDLFGHVTLVNVWATWCYACAMEHEFLVDLAKNQGVLIYGLDYKDDPSAALNWLHEKGDPYYIVASDINGDAAIDWGVYGTPETFLLDKNEVIRYKQLGPLTPEIWETTFKPLIQQLQDEP